MRPSILFHRFRLHQVRSRLGHARFVEMSLDERLALAFFGWGGSQDPCVRIIPASWCRVGLDENDCSRWRVHSWRSEMSDQKVVLITGASSGVGLSTARLLSQRGYTVCGTSRK